MVTKVSALFLPVFVLGLLTLTPVQGQQHRATRLGNPATRFANPLKTPEDLRRMLGSPALRADVDFIIKECGYQGALTDLRQAASHAPIVELKIPVGTRLPAMSSRENTKPVLLRDVLWAGKEPIEAYELRFASLGRRYRIVAPKACANFWVEDQGREPRPALALQCQAPAEVPLGRPVRVCFSVTNIGDAPEPKVTLALTEPPGATFVSATGAGHAETGRMLWEIELSPGQVTNVCATFSSPEAGSFAFASTARGLVSSPVESRCETRVVGISALLLETGDDPDPIQVGEETSYRVRVTNQGTSEDADIKVAVEFPKELTPVSADGDGRVEGQTVTFPACPRLAPKGVFEFHVKAKGTVAGDARVKFIRTSRDIPATTTGEESTRVY